MEKSTRVLYLSCYQRRKFIQNANDVDNSHDEHTPVTISQNVPAECFPFVPVFQGHCILC